jgi:hypothetical protein
VGHYLETLGQFVNPQLADAFWGADKPRYDGLRITPRSVERQRRRGGPATARRCPVASLPMELSNSSMTWSKPLVGRGAERSRLDDLVAAVRAGRSQTLVLRGVAGIGKTALLQYATGQARGCPVLVGAGIQADAELAYAGLHQVLGPLMGGVDRLVAPQRDALRTVFGLLSSPPPDQFLIALAVLNLLSDAAAEQPLFCIVDDAHWLDRASVHALAFAARRLEAEAVGVLFASRTSEPMLGTVPELLIGGLAERDARLLLESSLVGRVEPRFESQFLAESRGNPLALLELLRGVSLAELAGGFGLPGAMPLSERLEESFRHRLDSLPLDTRRLLLIAAAEPTGMPALLWRAAERLRIPAEAAAPAMDESLVEIGVRVLFRHPLVRSAVYQSASHSDLLEVHGALALATDRDTDPDRRAWHLALATNGSDRDVASELESSAKRAQARGGLAAAAVFGQRPRTGPV